MTDSANAQVTGFAGGPGNYHGSITLPGDQEPLLIAISLDGARQAVKVGFEQEVAGSTEWHAIDVRIVERLKFFEATFVTSGIPAEGVDLAWRVNADKNDDTAAGVLTVRPNDKRITGEKGFTLTKDS